VTSAPDDPTVQPDPRELSGNRPHKSNVPSVLKLVVAQHATVLVLFVHLHSGLGTSTKFKRPAVTTS